MITTAHIQRNLAVLVIQRLYHWIALQRPWGGVVWTVQISVPGAIPLATVCLSLSDFDVLHRSQDLCFKG
jgi:hypothetical protein